MKILIIWFWVAFSIRVFAQEVEPISSFSTFKMGFLGGINYSSLLGPSLLIEGTTNLSPQINIKLSFGYSIIYKDEDYTVNTYRYSNFFNLYQTEIYNVDKINYYVFPISLGIDYVFNLDKFSPYSLLEIGYNFYTYETSTLVWASNTGGSYNTYDEIPTEFKNEAPNIPKNDSYMIALGIGTKYKLSSSINLDIRYSYQFNKSLVNTNQILLGLEF
jgi:opacity protein-like surface antigen